MASESQLLNQWLDSKPDSGVNSTNTTSDSLINAVVYQLLLEDDIEQTIAHLDASYKSRPESIIINVKFANANPATANFDDSLILERFQRIVQTMQTVVQGQKNESEYRLGNSLRRENVLSDRSGLAKARVPW